ILGPSDLDDRGGAVAFTVDGVHPHDLMQLLDSRGVAVRGGHHCAAPLHRRLGVQSSSRASGYLYTTPEEVEALVEAVAWAYDFFNSRTGLAAAARRRPA
ncbi:MAG: aminotransferase class V-fold PLP-dependent enzyme, partial [Brooklawnia sp.]|nr:aminotransferase class V-fold PLP-dependent enzyme [Brooklawnia sp.]